MSTIKKFTVAASVLMLSLFIAPSTLSGNTRGRKQRPLTRAELKKAEARLAEMGYSPGQVDGVIDENTLNALIVFQKWEDRKLTGRLSRTDFHAIMSAAAPQARDSGYRHVEVDLDRQVMLLTDD